MQLPITEIAIITTSNDVILFFTRGTQNNPVNISVNTYASAENGLKNTTNIKKANVRSILITYQFPVTVPPA